MPLVYQPAEHGGQRVGTLLVIQAQCVCRNDLFADGMDAFVLLENVRVNGAVHLGDEIARDKAPAWPRRYTSAHSRGCR